MAKLDLHSAGVYLQKIESRPVDFWQKAWIAKAHSHGTMSFATIEFSLNVSLNSVTIVKGLKSATYCVRD